MKSLKIKLISICALAIALITAFSVAVGLIAVNADRNVTVTGSSVFVTSGNSEIWAHEAASTEGDPDYYTMFVLKSDGDAVNFRKNLAYNWYYNDAPEPEEGSETPATLHAAEGWFNARIGFELTDGKLGFEKYVITFESQQFVQTKDGKSSNYIIFYPTADGNRLNVLVTDDKDAELTQNSQTIGTDDISIKFDKQNYEGQPLNGGELRVVISCGSDELVGKFVNVGGTYARFSSSTTTPVTPLSFGATFPEAEGETENLAKMVIYNLNGQSFLLSGTRESNGHRVGGTVNDDTPPVLCLDKGVPFIEYEKEITFNYTVIDVITSSPSLETSYFALTKEQAASSVFNPEEYETENLFRKVTDSDDQIMVAHTNYYVPTGNDYNHDVFDDNFQVKMAVKVLLKLTDTTSTGGMSTHVMLDWYVDADKAVTVNDNNYIAVTTDEQGAAYAYTQNGTSNTTSTDWTEAVNAYQEKVDAAAQDLKAGNRNYFYLPSVETLLGDNATRYEDLSFYIYYNNGSRQQQTNRAYNQLSIQLSRAGDYMFTVFATDASGNDMYYFDTDGEKHEFTTGDIWDMYDDADDEGLRAYMPWFRFTVEAAELSIDEVEEQSTAYVGSTYTPDAFDINGVAYNTEYKLFRFENEQYSRDNGNEAMTYSEFMQHKDEFMTNPETWRRYFTEIYASSELEEGTEEYDLYHEYNWNSNSPSFVPQHANAFYLIECKVTSTDGGTQEQKAYMGIVAAPQVRAITGEDTWVQDNLASIILLSIAGASLIGIVLLLVIKPKNKGDLDEIAVQTHKKK